MEKDLESLRLLTLGEAAALLHVSTRTLQRMIRRNDLPAFKVGGQWRVRESQLAQWIQLREEFDPAARKDVIDCDSHDDEQKNDSHEHKKIS